MSPEELQEFAACCREMLAAGRVPNFAFWPERTILYVGMPEERGQMRFPPRVEAAGPFDASALPAARLGVELAQRQKWEGCTVIQASDERK